jgi:hypothetical protein
MAQPMHCDWQGHTDALADVLVTQIVTGDTSAWCFPHYVEISRAAVATFDDEVAKVEAADDAALARLEAEGQAADTEADAILPDQASEAPSAGTFPDDQPAGQEGPEPEPDSLGGQATDQQRPADDGAAIPVTEATPG